MKIKKASFFKNSRKASRGICSRRRTEMQERKAKGEEQAKKHAIFYFSQGFCRLIFLIFFWLARLYAHTDLVTTQRMYLFPFDISSSFSFYCTHTYTYRKGTFYHMKSPPATVFYTTTLTLHFVPHRFRFPPRASSRFARARITSSSLSWRRPTTPKKKTYFAAFFISSSGRKISGVARTTSRREATVSKGNEGCVCVRVCVLDEALVVVCVLV